MAEAKKANEFWQMIKGPGGRPKAFESPEDLWQEAVSYFTWVKENPLYESKIYGSQGKIKQLPKMRAMTELAFCLWAGISQDTFGRYKEGLDTYKPFCGVAKQIAQIIYTQKFEGAAAEFLNANIIARDLGLKDQAQTAVQHSGEIQFTPITGMVVKKKDAS